MTPLGALRAMEVVLLLLSWQSIKALNHISVSSENARSNLKWRSGICGAAGGLSFGSLNPTVCQPQDYLVLVFIVLISFTLCCASSSKLRMAVYAEDRYEKYNRLILIANTWIYITCVIWILGMVLTLWGPNYDT